MLAACARTAEPTIAEPAIAEPATVAEAPATTPEALAAPPAPSDSTTAPTPEAPAPPVPEPPKVSTARSARCTSDFDCALKVTHHCCGECPVTPITAISAAAAATAQKRESAHCAAEDHDCSQFRCPPVPPKCQIRAVCSKGFCAPALSKACEG